MMSAPATLCPPAGVVDCDPEVRAATPTYLDLRNRKKVNNFITAEVTGTGYLKYFVRNEPKDGMGCPGRWLFELAWEHFAITHQTAIQGIRGEWSFGDNWTTVNALTQNNQMSLEEAAKHTWAYARARSKGFTTVQVLDTDGTPGNWVSVDVVFLP